MIEKPVLELVNVYAGYGKIEVLRDISIKVFPGEIVSIIGANGAGKSTSLMAINNIVPITKGQIYYQGQQIHGLPAESLLAMGLCQVPEGRRIFPRLTVEENLLMGAFHRKRKTRIDKDLKWVYSLFPIMKERKRQKGGLLSGGEQQMLAIARALMGRPKLLLMDEPSLGLAPLIVEKIFDIISEINRKHEVSILLVEQNANLALGISSRGYVLETGNIAMEDKADRLLNNAEIRKVYLGED